jgi:hypothetical protein
VPAVGSGSGGSSGSGTGAGTRAGLERRLKKIWTGYVEDSTWRVRDSFALSLTSGWRGEQS